MAYQNLMKPTKTDLAPQSAGHSEAEASQGSVYEKRPRASSKSPPPLFIKALQENKEFIVIAVIGIVVVMVLFLVAQTVGGNPNQVMPVENVPARPRASSKAAPIPSPMFHRPVGGGMGGVKAVSNFMRGEGFVSYGTPTTGKLSSGRHTSMVLTLTAQNEYVITGACGKDCTDLDLVVYGPNGGAVGVYDSAVSSEPAVNVTASKTAVHTVEVRMVGCNAGTCAYSVSIFEKGAAQGK